MDPWRRPLKTASRLMESERWDGCRNELKCMMWVVCLVYKRAAPFSKIFTIDQKRMQNGEHWRVYGIFKAVATGQCTRWKYKIQNWTLHNTKVHQRVYGIFKAAASQLTENRQSIQKAICSFCSARSALLPYVLDTISTQYLCLLFWNQMHSALCHF